MNVSEGIRSGAIADSIRRVESFAQGEMHPQGDGLGGPAFQGASGFASLNFFCPYVNTKAADVLRMAAGSGVLAQTEADYNNPIVGALLDRWLIGPDTDAKRRLQLMQLAWDRTGTEFGSRAGLYEQLYSGDPERNGINWFNSPTTISSLIRLPPHRTDRDCNACANSFNRATGRRFDQRARASNSPHRLALSAAIYRLFLDLKGWHRLPLLTPASLLISATIMTN